jgi:exopolyphosphatase/guanosine-5'-triphosphate,3'-diphosphate pyrophosphatase
MYAVIDLGSNSFHLLIAELKNQHLSVVGRCSEKIQLAEGLSKSGQLSNAAIERGLQCLHQFKSILAQHPVEKLKVVGTEAMRRAANADIFVAQARALGFSIDVISGEQEARWIFNGICGPLPDSDNTRLTIDIGGASTEIALGSDHELRLSDSLPVGCVSWRDRFFLPSLNFVSNKIAAVEAAKFTLAPTLSKLKDQHWDEVYASSGSAKMLASIGYANDWSQGTITRDCICEIEKLLANVKDLQDIHITGLKPQRLDLLAPGLCIMSAIMETLEIEEIFYSPTALREGILAEMIQRRVDYKLQRESFK